MLKTKLCINCHKPKKTITKDTMPDPNVPIMGTAFFLQLHFFFCFVDPSAG